MTTTNTSTRTQKPLSRRELLEFHHKKLYEIHQSLTRKDIKQLDVEVALRDLEEQMDTIANDENLAPLRSFSTHIYGLAKKAHTYDASRSEIGGAISAMLGTISDLMNADDEHLRHWLG